VISASEYNVSGLEINVQVRIEGSMSVVVSVQVSVNTMSRSV